MMSTHEQRLVELATELSYAEAPEDVRLKIRLLVFDTLGCILVGTTTEHGRKVIAAVTSDDYGAQASVIGTSRRTDPFRAALANGTSAHSMELDDADRHTYYHPAAAIIPSALAAAETRDRRLRELYDAVLAGYEVSLRMARVLNPAHREAGWHTTGTCGTVGAAIAAGRLAALDTQQLGHAAGIAATQAAGLWQTVQEGTEAKRLHAGLSSARGILSADLAGAGLLAARAWLTGRHGMGQVMTRSTSFDWDAMFADLPGGYRVRDVGLKPYAACRFTHTAIEAGLGVAASMPAEEIGEAAFRLRMGRLAIDQLDNPAPQTLMSAQLSAQYAVATALKLGGGGMAEFTAGLADPEVMALTQSVAVEVAPDLDDYSRTAILEATTQSGQHYEVRVDIPKGEPEHPLTPVEVRTKFDDLSVGVLKDRVAGEVWRAVVEDVSGAMTLPELLAELHA